MDFHHGRAEKLDGALLPGFSETPRGFDTARQPLLAPRRERFGGRQARYRVHPQTLLRVFDPIDQVYQVFGSEWVYHAWLMRRFDSTIGELVVRPEPVAYMRMGKRFKAQPDLSFRRAGELITSLEWVCKEWEPERQPRYQHFMVTHGVHVVLTSSDQNEETSSTLIENLELARQVMTLMKDEDLTSITQAIHGFFVRWRSTTRGDLAASLNCENSLTCTDCFDAALFHLHCSGAIQVFWSQIHYDDDTLITRL